MKADVDQGDSQEAESSLSPRKQQKYDKNGY